MLVRYLNCYLPNPIPCVLDILEVIPKPTEQPRFLPWEFDTSSASVYSTIKLMLYVFSVDLVFKEEVNLMLKVSDF